MTATGTPCDASPKLSVIIVNYNVKAYLEQCLRAVLAALEGIPGEVFVVDNQSTDGSVEMVRERFPQVRLMANTVNVGFSRANNQAIRESRGAYVLLLNPDTVVGEDAFRKVVAFMDAHPMAGGVGVKMVDGTGRFLPESKRGLPTPAVAFYKIIGLARLFPRSRVFGRYHLGHLPEDRTARIEILSGACMFLRRETLDRVGLLDESFFMYGEDIDLSYRITLGGYTNHYFPEVRILHYKGESTKKSSVNYVFVFYNAMAIFARKHFTRKRPDLFSTLITGSIYLSALGAILTRFIQKALLPLSDLMWLALGWRLLAQAGVLPFSGIAMAKSFAFVLITQLIFGGYDKPVRLANLFSGVLMTTLAAALWMLVSGIPWHTTHLAVVAVLVGALLLSRILLHFTRIRGYMLRPSNKRRIVAIGSRPAARQALSLLWQTHFGLGRQHIAGPSVLERPDELSSLRRMLWEQRFDDVVFCAGDLSWQRIVTAMEELRGTGVAFKIAHAGNGHIIGPNSTESIKDLMILEGHAVSDAASRRIKRLLDIGVGLLLAFTLPVNCWFVSDRPNYMRNLWKVLTGRSTWVAYRPGYAMGVKLPGLRPGVIDPVRLAGYAPGHPLADRIALAYAKDYSALHDLRYIRKGFQALGGGPHAA